MVGRPTLLLSPVALLDCTDTKGMYSGRGVGDPPSACTGRLMGRGMRVGGGVLLVDVSWDGIG